MVEQGPYKLKHFIRRGNVQAFLWSDPTAYALLDDLGSAKVISIQTEVWTKHHDDGSTSPYTVFIFSLDGVENIIETYEDAREAMQGNNLARTVQSRQNEAGKVQLSRTEDLSASLTETELRRLEGYKNILDMKAHKTLQTHLKDHNASLAAKLAKIRKNYETHLSKTLSVINVAAEKCTTVYATNKMAAKLISANPKVAEEYRELCTRKLEEYQVDLKAEYKNRIDDIELEFRNWLKGHACASVRAEILDGLSATITKAKQFECQIPEVAKIVGDSITMEMLLADKLEKKKELQALAEVDLKEGGFGYTPEDLQFKSLFEDDDTKMLLAEVEAQEQAEVEMADQDASTVGGLPFQQAEARQQGVHKNIAQFASMVGVPAALLPMYNAPVALATAAPGAAGLNNLIASEAATQGTPSKSLSQIQTPSLQNTSSQTPLPINPFSRSPYTQDTSSSRTGATKVNLPSVKPHTDTANNTQYLIRKIHHLVGKPTPESCHPLPINPVSASPFTYTPTPTRIQHPALQRADLKMSNDWDGPTNSWMGVRTAYAIAEQNSYLAPNTQDSAVAFNGADSSQPNPDTFRENTHNAPSAKLADPNNYLDESLYDDAESPSMAPVRGRSYATHQDDLDHGHGPSTPPIPWAKNTITDDGVVDMEEDDENENHGCVPNGDLNPNSGAVSQTQSKNFQQHGTQDSTCKPVIIVDISSSDGVECEPEPDPYGRREQALESAKRNAWAQAIVTPVKGILSKGQEAVFQERFRGMKAGEIMEVLRDEAKGKMAGAKRKREMVSEDEELKEDRGVKMVWDGKGRRWVDR